MFERSEFNGSRTQNEKTNPICRNFQRWRELPDAQLLRHSALACPERAERVEWASP